MYASVGLLVIWQLKTFREVFGATNFSLQSIPWVQRFAWGQKVSFSILPHTVMELWVIGVSKESQSCEAASPTAGCLTGEGETAAFRGICSLRPKCRFTSFTAFCPFLFCWLPPLFAPYRLLEQGYQSDMVFIVHGKSFCAHRCILSARSAYFAEMFETKWKGKNMIVLKHPLVSKAVLPALSFFFPLCDQSRREGQSED